MNINKYVYVYICTHSNLQFKIEVLKATDMWVCSKSQGAEGTAGAGTDACEVIVWDHAEVPGKRIGKVMEKLIVYIYIKSI